MDWYIDQSLMLRYIYCQTMCQTIKCATPTGGSRPGGLLLEDLFPLEDCFIR